MDAQSKSRPPSAKVFWLIWLTTLALAAGSYFVFWHFVHLAAQATVFRQTAHGWERVPPLGSSGYDIRISPSGVVWVQTAKGLSRLDGASWHRFSASDFGTEYDYLPGQFTLDGEEVWGAATDGVVHFDGKRWRCYPDAVATEHAASVAAASGQVWVIDREGNLSQYDGVAWTVRKLDLPGVRWNVLSGRHPKLALTGNGTLWLAYQGLWRSGGSSWARIPGATSEAELVGTTSPGSYMYDGQRVVTHGEAWVADGNQVVGFDVDGGQFVRYKPHDLGLMESSRVYGVAGAAPVIAFATSQGPLWFDGSQWHTDQPKTLGVYVASSVRWRPTAPCGASDTRPVQ